MESVQFSLQKHVIPNCFEECATTTKNISNSNAKFVKFVRNRSKTSNFRHFFALFTKLHPMMPHWGSPLPSLTPGPSPADPSIFMRASTVSSRLQQNPEAAAICQEVSAKERFQCERKTIFVYFIVENCMKH